MFGNNGVAYNYILDVETNEININISEYPAGLYSVALVVNGEIVDIKTIIKQ